MSSVPDKIKMNTAIDKHSKLVDSPHHITSGNFMQYSVAFQTEMVPKSKLDFNINSFHRLMPLVSPTMGRGRINNRIYFVPYRTVWPMWDDFKNDVKHTYSDGTTGFVNKVPTFSDSDFRAFFVANATVVLNGNADNSDFEYVSSDGTSTFYKLTSKGRYALKLLHQLGYAVDFNEQHGDFESDALPLLCAAKIYIDWYGNSQYMDDTRYTDIIKVFKYDKSDYDSVVGQTLLSNIITLLQFVNYNRDYFVSAWDNPTNPNNGAFSPVYINDITNGSTANDTRGVFAGNFTGAAGVGADKAPILSGNRNNGINPTTLNMISQFALDSLKKVTDYLTRNRLAGSRTIDRVLARFGIVLDSDKLQRSYHLKDNQTSILFGDVTSTADTEGANLGSFAGKGVAWNDTGVQFSADEYGRFMVISTIIPEADYYQGQHRDTMRLSRLDFWTPEFDQLGTQAISKRELYVPMHNDLDISPDGWDAEVFGFTPRYADYKTFHSILSGDFRCNSINTGLDSWHLFRDVSSMVNNRIFPKHSVIFTEGFDASQYNRVFQLDGSQADNFIIVHQFNINMYFPGSSLWDTYEFDEKGDKVDINAGGTQVN